MSSNTLPVRNRFGESVRFLGLTFAALLLFCLTALIGVLAFAGAWGTPVSDPSNLSGGITCALIIWLFFLIFHVRKERLALTFTDRGTFLGRVRIELTELGYEVNQPTHDRLLGRPPFTAFLFGGTIQVQLNGNSAILTGPKISLENLRNRLRVKSHLESSRRTLEDSGWYAEQGQLRSVQIHFRAPAGQERQAVTQEVIDAMSQLGATVYCDITLRAQNDAGMEEVVIEKLIRDKLRRRGIAVTLYKKPLLPTDASLGSGIWEHTPPSNPLVPAED